MPRTENEWLYPRKNHNHNHNVDLGALETAPKRTRRSLRRDWNSLPSSETLRSSSFLMRARLLKHARRENIATRAVPLATNFWRALLLTAHSPRWNLIGLYWGLKIFPLMGVVGWVVSYVRSEFYLKNKSKMSVQWNIQCWIYLKILARYILHI